MRNISEIIVWEKCFCLLPIHLCPANNEENSFIMLNGGQSDFCLEMNCVEKKPDDFHSYAWSSNTTNFVIVGSEDVRIYNWKRDKKEEIIPKKSVEQNFEKFYKYLASSSYKSDKDVSPFIIEIFKQLRNITQEKNNAKEALNLLFILLAGIEEDVHSIDFNKWGLTDVNIPKNFDPYVEKIRNGIFNITPKLDIIIRHSAGVLFQEAQKEVIAFDRQIDLWGFYSNKVKETQGLYSSVHYTPSFLSRAIVENALRNIDTTKKSIKIFDPACGSSEFLIEALKQLHEAEYSGYVKVIGWDSSESAINTSRFLLTYEKRTIWKEKLDFEIKLVQDSLTETWGSENDLVFMNPPFVSWEQLTKQQREAVNDALGSTFSGRPNQASAFFYKAAQSLNTEGIIGCVIPSSLLSLDAYRKLRDEINCQLCIDLIGRLGNFVFEDALTDVSFILGHKPKINTLPLLLWTKNDKGIAQDALRELRKMHHSNSILATDKEFSIYKPEIFPVSKENWKPISFEEHEFYKTIERFVYENKLVKVETIFNVQQGIRTGNNSVFKISSIEYARLPEIEQSFFRPVVDNDSVSNGKIDNDSFVWFPYSENGSIIKTETDLSQIVPCFYNEVLLSNKKKLKMRAGIVRWWELTRPRNWQFSKKEKLISTEFGKSNSFAFDKFGNFVVERGNAWFPKKEFRNHDYYYFYLSVFSSPLFDRLLSIYSKQLLAGWDLGKKYTKDIPIPNVHSLDSSNSQTFQSLVEIGKELSKGQIQPGAFISEILEKHFYPQRKSL
ncbi:MAG: N-6 DNA methylase [Bacteroidetes bacterium]|nr:N-6 DNA methylase [Bacteroidota bacterium]